MVINKTTNDGPFDGASSLWPGIISLSESLAREVVIDSYFSHIRLPSGQFTRGHVLPSLGIELGTASLVVLLVTTMPPTRGHILTSLGIELGTASLVVLLITTMPPTRVGGIVVINRSQSEINRCHLHS